MKTLSLYQPWGSLIAEGDKTIETRPWKAPPSLIGQRIAIHAAKRQDPVTEVDDPEMYRARAILETHGPEWLDSLPRGAVVATALLQGCFIVEELRGDKIRFAGIGRPHPKMRPDPFGNFRPGRWLWVLGDVRKVDPPAPTRGKPWLWNWDPSGGEA